MPVQKHLRENEFSFAEAEIGAEVSYNELRHRNKT